MLKKYVERLMRKPGDEQLLALDIGSSHLKLAEIDLLADKPKLKSLAVVPLPGGVFSNNNISDTQEVGNLIKALSDKAKTSSSRVAFCLPGPASFVKRISTAYAPLKEFDEAISFEAANYIPDDLDAVHFDYQVLRHNQEKKSMDVLLVAVKNDIVESYLQSIEIADFQPVIADIDYFALSNIFEKTCAEEDRTKAVVLIDIGARYSKINILEHGILLFSGDVAVGSKVYNEVLKDTLGLGPSDAEKAKAGVPVETEGVGEEEIKSALDNASDQIVTELSRQLKFFQGAAELSKDVEAVYLAGGALQVAGLKERFAEKLKKPCHLINPFANLDVSEVSQELVESQGYRFAACLGMAYRRLADKKHAID